jgi:starch-binding outer membrane protein, SusD/RagB family
MRSLIDHARQAKRRLGAVPALLTAVALLGACDNMLEVDLPGQMTEEDVLQPELAPTLVNSAIADFECAFSMASALTAAMEDTWWRGTGYWGGWAEYRTIRPSETECGVADTGTGWYQALQTSRFLSEQAYEQISGWTDEQVANREQLLATAATYAGLSYQIFGETFCELAVNVGPLMTPEQVLEEGERWFTTALDHIENTGDFPIATTESLRQLALLGRARVRLVMGDEQGAADDASQIQPGFVAWVTRDATVRPRWNHTYRQLNVSLYSSIAGTVVHDDEVVPYTNYRYLTFDDLGRATVDGIPVAEPEPAQPVPEYVPEGADPRVPVVFTGEFLQDGVTDNWQQRKFTSLADPIPLARWAEAQLILAEVEGGAAAAQRINNVRDSYGLPHYQGATDEESIVQAIIEERRREFFFEGRFLADKLRFGLWFPMGVGANHKGFTYGNAQCFLMPESEYEANPNLPDP